MRKITAALLAVLVAGCSGMGMRSNSTGGTGAYSSSGIGSDPSMNSMGVINPQSGDLNLYHGG